MDESQSNYTKKLDSPILTPPKRGYRCSLTCDGLHPNKSITWGYKLKMLLIVAHYRELVIYPVIQWYTGSCRSPTLPSIMRVWYMKAYH